MAQVLNRMGYRPLNKHSTHAKGICTRKRLFKTSDRCRQTQINLIIICIYLYFSYERRSLQKTRVNQANLA